MQGTNENALNKFISLLKKDHYKIKRCLANLYWVENIAVAFDIIKYYKEKFNPKRTPKTSKLKILRARFN
jgi:hypothetical protein